MMQFQSPAQNAFDPAAYAELFLKSTQVSAREAQKEIESRTNNVVFANRFLSLPAEALASMSFDPTPEEIAGDQFFKIFGIAHPNRLASVDAIKQMLAALPMPGGKKLSAQKLEELAQSIAHMMATGKSLDGKTEIDPAVVAEMQAMADKFSAADGAEQIQLVASLNDSLGKLGASVTGHDGELIASAHSSFSEGLRDPNLQIQVPNAEQMESIQLASNPLKNGELFKDFQDNTLAFDNKYLDEGRNDPKPSSLGKTSAELDQLVQRQEADTSAKRSYVAGYRPSFSAEGGTTPQPVPKTVDSLFNRTPANDAASKASTPSTPSHNGESAIKQRLNAITNEVAQGRSSHGTSNPSFTNPSVNNPQSPMPSASQNQANNKTEMPKTETTHQNADPMKEFLFDSTARGEADNQGLTGKAKTDYVAQRIEELRKDESINKAIDTGLSESQKTAQAEDHSPKSNEPTRNYASVDPKSGTLNTGSKVPTELPAAQTPECREGRLNAFRILTLDNLKKYDFNQSSHVVPSLQSEFSFMADMSDESLLPSNNKGELSQPLLEVARLIDKAYPADWCPQFDASGKTILNFGTKEHGHFMDAFETAFIERHKKSLQATSFQNNYCPKADDDAHRLFISRLIAVQTRARHMVPESLADTKVVNWCGQVDVPNVDALASGALGKWLRGCGSAAQGVAKQIYLDTHLEDSKTCMNAKLALAFFKAINISGEVPTSALALATANTHGQK